jgi:mono/diheme cytochrome c family protein
MPRRRAFALSSAPAAALAFLAPQDATAGDWPPVAYTVSDGARIEAPLTRAPGDPARGAALAADPARGGCDGCHGAGGKAIGPAADPAILRLWIVNAAILRPALTGHAFYGLSEADPAAPTRLTAQEVEDLVAHLTARAQ